MWNIECKNKINRVKLKRNYFSINNLLFLKLLYLKSDERNLLKRYFYKSEQRIDNFNVIFYTREKEIYGIIYYIVQLVKNDFVWSCKYRATRYDTLLETAKYMGRTLTLFLLINVSQVWVLNQSIGLLPTRDAGQWLHLDNI